MKLLPDSLQDTLLALLLFLSYFPEGALSIPLRTCKPDDFGAAGDGSRLDTVAVSLAVNACKEGGIVEFAAGKTYLMGQVTISGREIYVKVPKGATLLASGQRRHYGARQDNWYLLHFHRCFECSLSGGGVIQGPAWEFVDNSTTPYGIRNWEDASCRSRRQCRPRLVGVCESSGVQITEMALRDSAFWTLHVRDSEHVFMRGLVVEGDMNFPNNDGIDIDGSSNVTLLQSYVATADDAVCIKATSGGERAVRHVLVSNCTLRSRSAAVKLGSETKADMTNITFSHLKVLDSNRGLAIQLRDHGTIRDVAFRQVQVATRRYPGKWWGAGEPIYVTALPRGLGSRVGRIVNVSFVDIVAEAEGGVVVIAGSPESLVQDVLLQDVRIKVTPLQCGADEDAATEIGVDTALLPPPPQKQQRGAAATAAATTAAAGGKATIDAASGVQRDAGGQLPRRVAAASVPAAAPTVSMMKGAPGGSGTAGGMQLWVKLDMRPGPYGSRAWLTTAPTLTQFVFGLVLRNVSFEVQAAALPNGSCDGDGGSVAAPPHGVGPWVWSALGLSRRALAEVRLIQPSLSAPAVAESQSAGSCGNGGGSGKWYDELMHHSVQVAAAELVNVRVVPAAHYKCQEEGNAGKAEGRIDWWVPLPGGHKGRDQQLGWVGTAVALATMVAAAAAAMVGMTSKSLHCALVGNGASASKHSRR